MARSLSTLFAIAVVLVGSSATAHAQGFGPGPSDRAFQFRLGGFFPAGDGALWSDNEEVFTLDVSDFDDLALGFSYVASISNYMELGFNVDFYDSTVLSGYRDYVDEDGFLILHDTTLETLPLTADLRLLPLGRYRNRPGGRAVRQPVPYVGGGIGMTLWEYEEVGDFIDFGDPAMPVFFDRFVDDGVAFEAHVLAGIELPLSPNVNFLLEGRYAWADDTTALGEIDLGGFSGYGGLSFRF